MRKHTHKIREYKKLELLQNLLKLSAEIELAESITLENKKTNMLEQTQQIFTECIEDWNSAIQDSFLLPEQLPLLTNAIEKSERRNTEAIKETIKANAQVILCREKVCELNSQFTEIEKSRRRVFRKFQREIEKRRLEDNIFRKHSYVPSKTGGVGF